MAVSCGPSPYTYTQYLENSIMKINTQADLQLSPETQSCKVIHIHSGISTGKTQKVFHISHTRYYRGYDAKRPQHLGIDGGVHLHKAPLCCAKLWITIGFSVENYTFWGKTSCFLLVKNPLLLWAQLADNRTAHPPLLTC
jgi:hypothetical protein